MLRNWVPNSRKQNGVCPALVMNFEFCTFLMKTAFVDIATARVMKCSNNATNIVCPASPGPYENSFIWQNMEKCKERKVVENHLFLISSVRILYLGRAVTALHSLTRP
jgi:hypothetical protein